ncbi:F-box only protein 6-like [Impatiens glandulifera]|uniref:F-box only protein 6-like n=1 Tax=Impatiens glandulifera TaxID=253017 RepID=UPI001FB0FC6D|nr:F-box only protein 6-like [Impatiens glandulifera]
MEVGETSRRKSRRNKLIICSSNEMLPKIWEKFPEDLFEVVGARLPTSTFFRFLCVSRKWNSMLTSHSFRDQYAQIPISQPWFYTITHDNVNTAAIYNPSSNKWHHQKVHSFLEKLVIYPLASIGGIICFVNIHHTRFFVGNPLTQTFKELPACSSMDWSQVAVGMWMNGKSTIEGYKILFLGCNGQYIIFDSNKNKWYESKVIPTSIRLPYILNLRSQAISVDGCLYFMSSYPNGMVCYNTLSGIWNHFSVPILHDMISGRFLVECGGRIMFVCVMIKSRVSICIWEFEKTTLLWKYFDKMPRELCLKLYRKGANMICVGNKDMIFLCFSSEKLFMLVTYDVVKKEWFKAPRSLLPRGMTYQRFRHKIAFYPCITATP